MTQSRDAISQETENKHYVSRTVVPYESKDEKKSQAPLPKVDLVIEQEIIREAKSLDYSIVFRGRVTITEGGNSVSSVIFEREEKCSNLSPWTSPASRVSATYWKYSFSALTLAPDGSSFAFLLKREKEGLEPFRWKEPELLGFNTEQTIVEYNEIIVCNIKTKKLSTSELAVNSKTFHCLFDKKNHNLSSYLINNSFQSQPIIIKYFSNNPKKFVIVDAGSSSHYQGYISFIEMTSTGLSCHQQRDLNYGYSRDAEGIYYFPFKILESPLKNYIALTNDLHYCSIYSQNSKGIEFVNTQGHFPLFAFNPDDLGYIFSQDQQKMVVSREGVNRLFSTEPLLKDCYFDADGNLILVHADGKNATVIRLKFVEELASELAKPIVPRILSRTLTCFSLDVNRVVSGYVGGDLRGLGLFSPSKGLEALENPYPNELHELMQTANPIEKSALTKYVDRGNAKEALDEFAQHLASDSPVRTFLENAVKVSCRLG